MRASRHLLLPFRTTSSSQAPTMSKRIGGCSQPVILAVAVLFASPTALAQAMPAEAAPAADDAAAEADESGTPSTLRIPAPDESVYVVQRRAYSKSGRFEFTPMFLTAVNPKFVGYVGASVSAAYHFQENLAIEFITSVYAHAFYSDLVYEAWRYENLAPEDVDLKKLLYFNALSLQFSALYGKLELYGLLVDYDFYVTGGLGFAITREPCFPPGDASTGCSEDADVDRGLRFPDRGLDAYKITGNLGLGTRVFFSELIGARIEFRDIAYPDRKVDANTGQASTDIRNIMMLFLGVSVLL